MKTRLAGLALAITLAALGHHAPAARADQVAYDIDILSREFYPELRDAWMYRINNNGVAAGYIQTATPGTRYQPATYSGNGQFQTFGVQTANYYGAVTGFNDRGDAVGNLLDGNFNPTPYLYRDGVVSYPNLPGTPDSPNLQGINNSGVAYGSYFDLDDETGKVFTMQGNAVTVLPISAPGFTQFFAGANLLNDAGLLVVSGASADFVNSQDFVYNTLNGSTLAIAKPDGFAFTSITRITNSGLIIGDAYTEDFSSSRMAFWDAEGTFVRFFDLPQGIQSYNVHFNDLGEAMSILDGRLYFFDGDTWGEREVRGLGGYTLRSISDFNDRGEFVGLVGQPGGGFSWGFVARPVPEPGSLLLSTVGLTALAAVARRRSPKPSGHHLERMEA